MPTSARCGAAALEVFSHTGTRGTTSPLRVATHDLKRNKLTNSHPVLAKLIMHALVIFLFSLWDSLISWSRPRLPFGFSKQSNIPQFILDARHPWIEANRPALESRPDVAHYLCQVDAAFNIDNEIPHDLFHRLEINNNRAGTNRLEWSDALRRLREIQTCGAALEGVKKLELDIYVYDGREPHDPSSELLGAFLDVLASMVNVKTIVWDMPCEQTQVFGEAFITRELRLPSVETLILGPFSEYMVALCPNLNSLAYSLEAWHCDWQWRRGKPCPKKLLIKAAAGNTEISSFSLSMGQDYWLPSLLEGEFPSISQATSSKADLSNRGTSGNA